MHKMSRRGFAAGMACAGAAGLSPPAWASGYGPLSLERFGRDSFAGHTWGTQQDTTKPYAIQEDLGFTPRRHRFEVRSDDVWNGKTHINRAEFNCLGKHEHGAVIWFSYAMRIGAGPPVTNWNVLGQFHHTPDDGEAGISPPFAINFIPGEKLRFIRRFNPLPLDSQPTVATMHTRRIERDRWYRLVGRVKFGWEGNGSVRIWMDGSKIVGLGNTDIGYNDAQAPYWKFGIYRRKVPETLVVEYANFEYGESSLIHRVANPLSL